MNRDKLIKALKRLKVETGSLACMGCGYEHNCSTSGCAIIRAAVEELEKSRWRSMPEEPPEADGKYVCLWQGKSVDTGMFLNGHFRLYGEIKDRLVSHWMPQPNPPEVSEDGE